MSEYVISTVHKNDRRTMEKVEQLLLQEGIRRDAHLDYTAAMLDEDYHVIATGSCYGNTLRCMAVDSAHQGEALMNDIVTHLIEVQYARGNYHLFLYTKADSAKFFGFLGFSEIARVEGQLVFMENRKNGFSDYLKRLKSETEEQLLRLPASIQVSLSAGSPAAVPGSSLSSGAPENPLPVHALVMNANPFTRGHRYLTERASEASSLLHLFVLSEEESLVPFSVRKRLIREGTADLPNIIYHDSGSYIISSATFPAYFQKDSVSVIEGQARLDLQLFRQIAAALGIQGRFVGEEPSSLVTGIYNKIMAEELPAYGLRCHILPRMNGQDGNAISASTVRQALKEGNDVLFRSLVPDSTYRFFHSEEAAPVLEKIRAAENVIHY